MLVRIRSEHVGLHLHGASQFAGPNASTCLRVCVYVIGNICCNVHMHFGSIIDYRNLVYYFIGKFLKRVYAFRKYTRTPESSILVPGAVFVKAHMHFGSISDVY
jgi:hypothetical protein